MTGFLATSWFRLSMSIPKDPKSVVAGKIHRLKLCRKLRVSLFALELLWGRS